MLGNMLGRAGFGDRMLAFLEVAYMVDATHHVGWGRGSGIGC